MDKNVMTALRDKREKKMGREPKPKPLTMRDVRALAKRKCGSKRDDVTLDNSGASWNGCVWPHGANDIKDVLEVYAPTRKAVLAGLYVALLTMQDVQS